MPLFIKNFFILLFFLLSACASNYSDSDFDNYDEYDGEGYDVIYNDPDNAQNNNLNKIEQFKPKRIKYSNLNKWNTSRLETRWHEYKGTMVKVEILLGSSDLKEMRLKLIPNSFGLDIDGDNQYVLSKVADFEMKKICGRNATSISMIYDKPTFDLLRPNEFFDYRVTDNGTNMREYGFRCIYNN